MHILTFVRCDFAHLICALFLRKFYYALLTPIKSHLNYVFCNDIWIFEILQLVLTVIFLFQAHINTCDYTLIACVHTHCKAKVKRLLLAEHLKDECLYRTVRCENCQESLPFVSMEVGFGTNQGSFEIPDI